MGCSVSTYAWDVMAIAQNATELARNAFSKYDVNGNGYIERGIMMGFRGRV